MQRFCDLDLGVFKNIQGQTSWCQSIDHGRFLIQLLLTPSSYLLPFLKYLMYNFDDVEPKQFKVIQGQRSWCHSIALRWFHRRPVKVSVSVTVLDIFDIIAIFEP